MLFRSRLKSLIARNIPRLSDAFLERLPHHCPLLEVLDLEGSAITDKGIPYTLECLADYYLPLAGLQHLTPLLNTLTRLGVARCKGITDKGVASLFLSRQKGEEVEKEGEGNTTHLPLVQLHMAACTRVGPPALAAIATTCPSLASIDISDCPRMTDNDIDTLTSSCKSLTRFPLPPPPKLLKKKRMVIISIFETNRIIISRCYRLTGKSIVSIATHCKELEVIGANSCKIDNTCLQPLLTQCHAVRIIMYFILFLFISFHISLNVWILASAKTSQMILLPSSNLSMRSLPIASPFKSWCSQAAPSYLHLV